MNTGTRVWMDQRAHRLYSLAVGSKEKKIRQEAVFFLGALERAGCDDAAWAMDSIRKRVKGGDTGPLS